jgi:hypothetical protein
MIQKICFFVVSSSIFLELSSCILVQKAFLSCAKSYFAQLGELWTPVHFLFCQLPNCNLFIQHVIYLYGETPLVNYGPQSILLHSYDRTFTRIIYFLANNYLLPHDTFNPLFIANM